jgi:hypothetical protein
MLDGFATESNSAAPVRPQALPVNPDTIPAELKALSQWVVWRYVEEVDPETGESDWDKPPVNARTLGLASATDPGTWADFATALAAYLDAENGLDGVGFVPWRLPGDETAGVIAVDLDHCRDPQSGRLETWASGVLADLPAYAELSPSGTGVRLFCLGKLPPSGRKKGPFEVYETSHYVTVTGQRLPGRPAGLLDLREQLLAVHRRFFPPASQGQAPPPPHGTCNLSDEEVIRLASESRSGAPFRELWVGNWSGYSSQSEADLALCSYLAFWCGPDEQRIADLFAQSGLYRSKWKRDDYRTRTVKKALAGKKEFYGNGGGERYTATGVGGNGAHRPPPPPPPFPPTVPMCDLRTAQEGSWLWHGYLNRGGLTLLSALWKSGKTTLLTFLLKALEQGGQFCGLDITAGKVLYVTEESETRWARRRDDHGLKGAVDFLVRPYHSRPDFGRWEQFVRHLGKVASDFGSDLLVIDTISRFWPVKDENDASQVTAALMPLQSLGDRLSVLPVHHNRKGDGQEATASRGSGALTAVVDTIIELRRYRPGDRKDRRRVLTAYGRWDETPDEVVIELALDGSGFTACGDRREAGRADLVETIKLILPASAPGRTAREIAEAWPGDASPKNSRLLDALNYGADTGLWQREGSGARGDPYRFWRP